jgi:hypothetical protein
MRQIMVNRQQMITERNESHVISGLGAVGPEPEMREKLMLFGQFVGDWEIVEARYPQPDGTEIKKNGEIHFGWILDGRAVQDVWMIHEGTPPRPVPAGTTIRFYDPKIDAWHSIWIAPKYGVIQTFVARMVGEGIVLEGQTKEGYPERWIFSEITTNTFRWRAVESHDNQSTWKLTEEMRVQRRTPASNTHTSPNHQL